MNLLSFLSFLILAITLLTMVFGIIAYFLYKARERKKKADEISYDQALKDEGSDMIFFTKD